MILLLSGSQEVPISPVSIYDGGIKMAYTSSLAFPYMFDIARNSVSVLDDNVSIVNRVRLLMLTQPTELYNEPNFGVGLKENLFKYNTDNEKAIILEKVKSQCKLHEPYVVSEDITYSDGLLFTGSSNDATSVNRLEMTIGLPTTYGDTATIESTNL